MYPYYCSVHIKYTTEYIRKVNTLLDKPMNQNINVTEEAVTFSSFKFNLIWQNKIKVPSVWKSFYWWRSGYNFKTICSQNSSSGNWQSGALKVIGKIMLHQDNMFVSFDIWMLVSRKS